MMTKGTAVKMDITKVEEMRSWAHIYGRAVRQKTNRQQTTMASAGTMPTYVYDRMEQLNENTVASLTNFRKFSYTPTFTYRKLASISALVDKRTCGYTDPENVMDG